MPGNTLTERCWFHPHLCPVHSTSMDHGPRHRHFRSPRKSATQCIPVMSKLMNRRDFGTHRYTETPDELLYT